MRIEIDEDGSLRLDRGGKMKNQLCPYTEESRCGDWCPLFREPYYFENDKVMEVSLCRGAHQCKKEDFTDRRGK